MTFFYDLNKRLADLASKQDAQQLAENTVPASRLAQALNERDLGKHNNATTGFAALAKKAGGGNIEKGNRIAGAQLAKMRAKGQVEESDMEESALQAYIGDKKYGKQGMDALRKAGREHVGKDKMNQIRNRYDKMDEADMEEGNEFSGELAKAKMNHKSEFEVDGKKYKVTEADPVGLEEKKKAKPDYIDLDGDGDRKETMKKAASDKKRSAGTAFDPEVAKSMFSNKDEHPRHNVKDTGYSKRYTRKDNLEAEKDDAEVSDAPKSRGRPKGADKGPERVTAKSYKYKAGRPSKTKEDLDSDGVMMTRPSNMSSEDVNSIALVDKGEYDQEGKSAKHDIKTIVRHAQALHKILGDDDNLPEWVQSKLAKIEGMMIAVDEYMQNQDQEVAEVAPPGAKAERMVKGIKKSLSKDGHLSDKDKAIAYATTWKAKKDGKVEEAGKPDFLDLDKDGNKKEPMKKAAKDKKEEKVDETTVAGSVATAPAAAKKSSGGMQFGKGVYESINNQVESMITEGMNITVNMNAGEDGQTHKSITVTAEGEEADQLAALLKMAGLHGQSSEACGTCGASPCGCEQTVDEAYGDTDETLNDPDWPTDTETLLAQPELRTYSGGLNGPKSTGQTTIPVVASQLRRQVSMEENVELERSLFKTWKNYKG